MPDTTRVRRFMRLLLAAWLSIYLVPAVSGESRAHPRSIDPGQELRHIAFGSCLHQRRDTRILAHITATRPDVFLFLGDNVYGDSGRADQAELRRAYEEQFANPDFRGLLDAVPVLATWDDHDFGMNDGGADHPHRAVAEALFDEFWRVPPDSPAGSRPGVHDALVLGPEGRRVQVILLDTRSFRSELSPTNERGAPGRERYVPAQDPDRTMLGADQWQWLATQLQKPAEVRLIVSSIQVLADGHGWEAWRTLPLERERLFRTLRESGARGVVLLSGDRHRGGIYRRDDVLDYPLHELTSSSLNLPIPGVSEERGPWRLGGTVLAANYGDLVIDWDSGMLHFSIRGEDGASLRQLVLPIDVPVEAPIVPNSGS